MSRENVEAVKAIWPTRVELVASLEAGAPPELAAAIGPGTEIVFMPIAPGAESPNFLGLEGFAEGWSDWLEPYESYWIEVEDFIDAGGDEVLIPAKVRARTRRDGVLIEHAPAAVTSIRDGMITLVTFYLDRAEALEAVGLSE